MLCCAGRARAGPGLYSPQPLPASAYAEADVVPEEQDMRLLSLLRAQVGAGCGRECGHGDEDVCVCVSLGHAL